MRRSSLRLFPILALALVGTLVAQGCSSDPPAEEAIRPCQSAADCNAGYQCVAVPALGEGLWCVPEGDIPDEIQDLEFIDQVPELDQFDEPDETELAELDLEPDLDAELEQLEELDEAELDEELEQEDGLDEEQDELDPNRDSDEDGIPDRLEDHNEDGVLDPDETDPFNPDTDADGLSDGCEDTNLNGLWDEGETDPRLSDSDGDGLEDGEECAAQVCDFEACGSDPRAVDTDGDGLSDLIETQSDYQAGPSDPRLFDTDGDGLGDGAEDFDGDGFFDEGELDPTLPSTDGLMGDDARLEAQACTVLESYSELANVEADLRFIHDAALVSTELVVPGAEGKVFAWSLEHPLSGVAGFLMSRAADDGVTELAQQLAHQDAALQLELEQRVLFVSWDGAPAAMSRYLVEEGGSSVALRSAALEALDGVESSVINLSWTGGVLSNRAELILTTVFRAPERIHLLAAVHPLDAGASANLRSQAEALTDGSSLAPFAASLMEQPSGEAQRLCVPTELEQVPMVDFLFVIDDTFSMEPYQLGLSQATSAFFQDIRSSMLSARWAVLSTDLANDNGYDGVASLCGLKNSPMGPGGSVWAPFEEAYESSFQCRIRDPLGNQACDPSSSEFPGYAEYGLLCSKWAIDYVQGRGAEMVVPEDRQREGSRLVVVIFTNENEDLTSDSGAEMPAAVKAEVLAWLGVTAWNQVTASLVASRFADYFINVASAFPWLDTIPVVIYERNSPFERAGYYEFIDEDPSLFPDGASLDIEQIADYGPFLRALVERLGGLLAVPLPAPMPSVALRLFASDGSSQWQLQRNSGAWILDVQTNSLRLVYDPRLQLGAQLVFSGPVWVLP
ncbi:MAG: hypothetical protein RBU37_02695 [Myxococcota bacterium]|jgi:hypothetical protein|nr:hypothetical protein [Myxococcota bacterium]